MNFGARHGTTATSISFKSGRSHARDPGGCSHSVIRQHELGGSKPRVRHLSATSRKSLLMFITSLVFIHGLNGHPQRTWMHGSGFYWPWALRTELKSSRVMTFGYNAGVRSKLAENLVRIKGVAATLNGRLANRRTTREVWDVIGKPICSRK